MKKIIRKFWGVALVVVLLSTLFVGTVPQASAATLAWSTTGASLGLLNQVAASDASIVKIASNGDIFVVDQQANPDRILKSVDGGHTFAAAVIAGLVAGDTITGIAISPYYATDGYVYAAINATGGTVSRVYQSTNAGVSFLQLGGTIGAAATQRISCITLDPTFHSGIGEIMVGTVDVTAGAPYGDVYIWGAPALTWTAQALAQDITAVAYSPSYLVDRTIFAVGSTAAAGTVVNIKVFTNAWNLGAYFPAQTINGVLIKDTTTAAGIITSSLAFPENFQADNPLTCFFYVGTNSATAANDDVYRVYLVPTVATAGVPLLFTGGGVTVSNVAYVGAATGGTLYAGRVAAATWRYTITPNSLLPLATMWIPGGAVTGTTNAYVAPSPGFATDATLYVGTTSAAAAESALNVSRNAGLSFVQTGLIDTVLTAMLDFVPYSATEWYLVTQSAGVNNSLWKTTDGGAVWERINLIVGSTAANPAAVRLSPAFGTDGTMYFFEVGATLGAPTLRMSQDSGTTWAARFFDPLLSGVGVGDVAVVDSLTLYAGSAALLATVPAVYKTGNNGFWWTAQALPGATAATGVFQLKRDAATGHLLAGTTGGQVYLNALAAVEAWVFQGAAAPGTVNEVVAFDANYSTNNIIYAGDSGPAGTVGLFRTATNAIPTIVPWVALEGTIVCMGIVVAPDGVLYAADATAAPALPAVAPGGVYRILAPTTGTAAFPPAGEFVSTGDGLTATNTLASLAYAAGSNILYAIENIGANKIVTYTDTLSTATPGISSPTDLSIVGAPGFLVTVAPVAGALAYQVRFDNRADFLTVVAIVNCNILNQALDNSLAVAGDTVYFQTRVSAPVFGPWSQTYSVVTQLVPVAPNAPVPAGPALGGTITGGYDAALQPTFQWGAVPGATAFEFVLAKDVAMTDKVIDATGANALGVVTAYKLTGATLSYSTTYYWQVRAISATSQTAWCNVQAFTTMDKPVEPTTIVIPTQEPAPTPTIVLPTPTVIVNNPTPTQAAEKVVNPTYIWAIIIIGAVLVIAVIVLIVRTRRSV